MKMLTSGKNFGNLGTNWCNSLKTLTVHYHYTKVSVSMWRCRPRAKMTPFRSDYMHHKNPGPNRVHLFHFLKTTKHIFCFFCY